ncbi:MAG: universal stress protein [Chloroflexi bacterium]|nr:universal stress protein [Chloroflexota bacterium]
MTNSTSLKQNMDQSSAYSDFIRAHRKAGLQSILSSLTGRSNELLAYNEVLGKLQTQGQVDRGLKEIPLAAIIGSVGRYNDFDRNFLPRHISDQSRWSKVKVAMESLEGVPPIDVYQIGNAYFVKDGNHRVSVARELHHEFIEAYVVEVRTRVPLTADTRPDDLILKAEYASFLEKTGIDHIIPETDFTVTVPGGYDHLAEHISVHQYFMGIDLQRPVSLEEAVRHWYETIYSPVIGVIKGEGILREFPNRTETDLYLWLTQYQAELQEELGWRVDQQKAALTLKERFSSGFQKARIRLWSRLRAWLVPLGFESGPVIGAWRKSQQAKSQAQPALFRNLLLSLQDSQPGWQVLEQAIILARKENAQISALHLVENEALVNTPQTQSLIARFNQRIQEAGLQGSLAVHPGTAASVISERARWCDMVIVNLAHAPGGLPIEKIRSGFHTLLHKVGQPILAVPGVALPMHKALLAYDGSPKANEALYVAVYLAQRWNLELTLLTVFSEDAGAIRSEARAHQYAMDYLTSHQVAFVNMLSEGDPAEGILNTARDMHADLLIMGSYGYNPLLEVFLGSAIDQVLQNTVCPVLICR